MPSSYPNRQSFCPDRYYPHWASPKRATLSLVRRATDSEHLLHVRLLFTPITQQRELKSRHPFVPAALKLLKDLDKFNTTASFWADQKWNTEWQKNTPRLHTFIPSPGPSPPGMTLPSPSWVRLNRLRTGVGLFRSTIHKRGLVPSANYKCGTEEQTADHILASCSLYHHPNGVPGLAALDDDTVDWLKRLHWASADKISSNEKNISIINTYFCFLIFFDDNHIIFSNNPVTGQAFFKIIFLVARNMTGRYFSL